MFLYIRMHTRIITHVVSLLYDTDEKRIGGRNFCMRWCEDNSNFQLLVHARNELLLITEAGTATNALMITEITMFQNFFVENYRQGDFSELIVFPSLEASLGLILSSVNRIHEKEILSSCMSEGSARLLYM